MRRRVSSSDSGGHKDSGSQELVSNIRTKPPHIYDNITRRLLQLGVTLSITTFIGLIVRYAVQEFDPSVSTITVTTSKINNRDIASLSVSKHFLERILEFVEESIAIVAAIIPLGFPLCTLFNRYFARIRAGNEKIEIRNNLVLNMIPKYVVIGDAQACQLPNQMRLKPLVRDTIYHLIKAHLKPKLIVEDSYEEARKLGIRIGLIRREHHKLAVIKSVDLLKYITDSRGDIKQGKVRYLLSRMKIMSQSTPADKSLLINLIKHCESQPNENLAYLGYSFTDPEAMRVADCAITFQDCDDEDVRKCAHAILKSESMKFTDLYLFIIVCLLTANITQSYALYQISASVSCCVYRFLSITVFQEQIISHSQFTLLVILQQVFAIIALLTKWLSSLPQAPMSSSVAEMSHAATEDSLATSMGGSHADLNEPSHHRHHHHQHHHHQQQHHNQSHHRNHSKSQQSMASMSNHEGSLGVYQVEAGHQQATSIRMQRMGDDNDDTLASSADEMNSSADEANSVEDVDLGDHMRRRSHVDLSGGVTTDGRQSRARRRRNGGRLAKGMSQSDGHHIHLSGIDLDQAVINSKLVTAYKQTFHNSSLIDDVTYRLAKLHIAYQVLVMIIIMIFGNTMFQLNTDNNRQHQTLAFNSLMMNNIFNLANCFNQFGKFNLRSGFRNHPFFVCVLLMAIFIQVIISELNAFGLENLNPTQWFVCFVFAALSALIAPLTGQQRRGHRVGSMEGGAGGLEQKLQKHQQVQEMAPVSADYHRVKYQARKSHGGGHSPMSSAATATAAASPHKRDRHHNQQQQQQHHTNHHRHNSRSKSQASLALEP